ncbi:enoyl-CoA hydratase-related protein [Paraflavitalea sp. CAU 1676]|uniref:enoyl-CoA hydratase/isomerase family protein n=1 Tax=Paraflavitalea sp. CAU 1676 TaxID=3032598 RepID=UPI0023DCA4DB|nr:enoyl-CoA hydratase-related protein [Paraflavitalea sp. CAU 1676]MDF2187296.1 enoyl-CoA hydratase-related protein [Paraflavitalea sp. CAU 1676]
MYQTLLVTTEEQICTITINRPDKLNAINKTVMEELGRAVDEVYSNPDIKAAIITGSGIKAFVAGADISEFQGLTKEQGQALSKKGHDVFFKIERSPKPIVAAVNGFALGGGCELALACHFMIAADNAKFGQPEVNLGLIPGYGGTQRLVQVAGKGRAMELLMSGRMIDAQEAKSIGMINAIVPPRELLTTVKELLQTIISKAPIAVASIIACVNNFDHTQQGYDYEVQKFGECFATEDMVEGASAFLEKRKPVFKGK